VSFDSTIVPFIVLSLQAAVYHHNSTSEQTSHPTASSYVKKLTEGNTGIGAATAAGNNEMKYLS
jgi:hypothetical protein